MPFRSINFPRKLVFLVVAGAVSALAVAGSGAANPPAGTDATVTISEDIPYTFAPGDFGFTDSGDMPQNHFERVVIDSLPALGSLQLDGLPVVPGSIVSMKPVPGIVWTAGNTGRNWWGAASSSDGSKLVAVQMEGRIFVSGDGGATWTARESSRKWAAVASSADGTLLAAIAREGQIYTSVDSGNTWAARNSNRNWWDIASSSDGTKLVAVENNGNIYTSSDSGVSWTARETSRYWIAVASSADGTRLVALPYEGPIFASNDAGITWTARGNAKIWCDVAMSADGSRLVGAVEGGSVFISTDFGITWQALPSAGVRPWRAVASSADGSRLVAVERGDNPRSGQIHVSTDSGATWVPRAPTGAWGAIAASANAEKLVALEEVYGYDSEIYQSSATVPTLVYTPAPNAFGAYNNFTFQVADDGDSGQDIDPTPNTLTLNVVNVNDPPVAPEQLPDQVPVKGVPFQFQIPADKFTDADPGTILTYSASWQNGGAFPPWLTFNAATRTFSGTPGNADEGTFRVGVTVTDQGNPPLSASTYFILKINNDSPAGTSRPLSIDEDTPYSFSAASFGFTDPDDSPPNTFTGITLSTVPTLGTLTVEGTPQVAGAFVSMFPEPQLNWTPQNTSRYWAGVASSANGMKLAAITGWNFGSGQIQLSNDAGVTWTPTGSPRVWEAIASSANGTVLVAAEHFGLLYISTDSGVTWTGRAKALNWSAVASSADGTKLVATVAQGHIYVSSDSGTTWTPLAEELNWSAVASSADGTRLIAAEFGGKLYTSSDSGATWTPRATNGEWQTVASSADGLKLVAAGNASSTFPCKIQTSTNGGLTWTERESARDWTSVASSSDGARLCAVAFGDKIFTSQDAGATWRQKDSNRNWTACACSSDGSKLIACVGFGRLYASVDAVPILVYTPPLNATGSPYTNFTFQVEDDGTGPFTRDPNPKSMALHVNPANDAPTVATAIPDQTATERLAFAFQVSSTTFSDDEADSVLTYSARQANGDPLPGWLSFNPATRTITGTPGPSDAGFVELTVIATDDGIPLLSTGAPFLLTVANIDEAPLGTNGRITLTAGEAYTFAKEDFGFTDPADFPANVFTRIRFSTLPGAGILSVDGVPAVAGGYAAIAPTALGIRWNGRASARNWTAIASSTNGSKLVAAALGGGGRIYTSTDSGTTWIGREGFRAWGVVASSGDGTRLAAGEISGRIFVSSDSGATWTASGPSGAWISLESSSDGAKLAAVASGGRIYTSGDFGGTWTARENVREWSSIASSSDGTKLAAVVRNGRIYTSTDSGVSWVPRESPRAWKAISSSADGNRLAAVVQNGRIHTSDDAGVTWKARDTNRNWYDIAASADGMFLAAVVRLGRVYTSTDAGLHWTPRDISRPWECVCVAPDGRMVVAAGVSLPIYLSTPLPAQAVLYTPPAGGGPLLYADIGFQVEDDGLTGNNLDQTPNTLRLNYAATPYQAWAIQNNLPPDPAADRGIHLIHFANGLEPNGSPTGGIAVVDGVISRRGLPSLVPAHPPEETTFGALFGRRKNSALTYQVQFSADLADWQPARTIPVVLADDGMMEACLIRFPSVMNTGKIPRFFRVSVTSN